MCASLQRGVVLLYDGRTMVCAAVVHDGYEERKIGLLLKDGVKAFPEV